jgi:anti-sigma B factor antagonist
MARTSRPAVKPVRLALFGKCRCPARYNRSFAAVWRTEEPLVLEIEHKEVSPETVVIRLEGRLMLGSKADEIEKLVPGLLERGYRNFIFDLGGVTHLDSTGIGQFIFTFNKVYEMGGQLRLASATEHVRDSFHVTRLDSVFLFYPTVEAACEGLG